jgi:hypothetical protein
LDDSTPLAALAASLSADETASGAPGISPSQRWNPTT